MQDHISDPRRCHGQPQQSKGRETPGACRQRQYKKYETCRPQRRSRQFTPFDLFLIFLMYALLHLFCPPSSTS